MKSRMSSVAPVLSLLLSSLPDGPLSPLQGSLKNVHLLRPPAPTDTSQSWIFVPLLPFRAHAISLWTEEPSLLATLPKNPVFPTPLTAVRMSLVGFIFFSALSISVV